MQYGQFSLPINVSYDADLWGRIRKSIEAAKEQAQASAADLENVKLELQTELASYYFTIRGLDSQKRLRRGRWFAGWQHCELIHLAQPHVGRWPAPSAVVW